MMGAGGSAAHQRADGPPPPGTDPVFDKMVEDELARLRAALDRVFGAPPPLQRLVRHAGSSFELLDSDDAECPLASLRLKADDELLLEVAAERGHSACVDLLRARRRHVLAPLGRAVVDRHLLQPRRHRRHPVRGPCLETKAIRAPFLRSGFVPPALFLNSATTHTRPS